MSNITTIYLVPSTPNTRIHKDYSLDHVIGDILFGVLIRRMIKTSNEQAFISAVYKGRTHKDLHTCLFAYFLSQVEHKKVIQALTNPSWIEAMQDELLQFKLQKVWTLVDLPYGQKAIGTKWVYRNKKDKRGIVIRNKERLVALGYTQEEGIDYDEVFTPVARIEAIRLFLAYASFKDFVVYQMDVKSAFLYGKIEEEVYVCQPPGFEDPEFPDKVYKVEKVLYGLHQAPKAWYETLSTYLLDNGFQRGQIDRTLFIKRVKGDILLTASTPMETAKPLLKDAEAEDVDVHLYRSMIGSLMYLTALRPDIMFVVCACARFQVTPKISHLYAVKRIFRYLKGQPKLGLWYPKDSPFDLEAYTDSDYASVSLDRKSTTGGCQFLRSRLISWQCKKQTILANSTIKAKNVVAASCCGQFWNTATARTLDNGEMEITVTIDGKVKIVSEASIRRHLKLEDSNGHFSPQWRFLIHTIIHCLSSKKTAWEKFSSNIATAIICLATNRTFNFSKMIFDGMVKNLESKHKFLMYPRFIQVFLNKHKRLLLPHNRTYIAPTLTQKLFSNMRRASKGYTGVDIPLFPTMLVQGPVVQGEGSTVLVESHHTPTSAPSTSQPPSSSPSRRTTRQESVVPQPRSPTQTNVADEAASTGVDVRHGGAATTVTSLDAGQGSGNIDKTPSMPHDSPLPRVYTLGSDEGRMQHNELMDLVTKLSDRVVALETDLQQTKKVYGTAFTKLIKKVKKLEKTIKTRQARRKAIIVVSDDEEDLEDPSKHGRKIAEIDQDPDISLVQHDAEVHGRHDHDFEFTTAEEVHTANKGVSTTKPVSTVGASVSTAGASSAKDKGKAIIEEAKTIQTKTKLQLEQEILGYEEAMRLHAEIVEEERHRIVGVQEEASSFNIEEWDDIQTRVEADEEFVQRLQSKERRMYFEAEKSRLLAELINERKRYFAAQRAEERRKKPLTQAQHRTYMSQYIKNMGSHTLKQLKSYSFDEIKNLFEITIRRVHTFVPMESESERVIPELAAGSSKRDAEEELVQESSKRQKTGESSEPVEEPKDKEEEELSQERIQQMMIIVPEQGMNVEALQTKYPIIDWEIYTEGARKYWKIIRVGNHTEVYQFFDDMLKAFDREDLVKLWSLVKEKFTSTEPTEDKERELWVELKRLFEPDTDDELWKLQKHIHDNLTWKLYDSCGVHHVYIEDGIDIYMLVEKEYPLSRGTLTLMLVAKLLVEQDSEMSRELLRKIFMQVERPRR
ncbi:putative ribonuclease H-like domain-containing protein [Tanacetum coccineum]